MRIAIINLVAKALGVLIHIDGLPYGSNRNVDFSNLSGRGGVSRSSVLGCASPRQNAA